MKFLAIIEATIREGIARKTILGMFIVSTVAIVIAVLLFQMDAVQHGLLSPASSHVQVQNGHTSAPPPSLMGVTVLDGVWIVVSTMLLLICVFIGVFVTAGFITSLMEKGSIDLLLSKPVARWTYIVGRYVGSVLIILLEVTYLILGLWIGAGLSLGSWNAGFLGSILSITLAFAGVFSLITLIGVLTRSSWLAIIIGLALYILGIFVIPMGQFVDKLINGVPTQGILTTLGTVMHYIIPSQGIRSMIAAQILGRSLTVTPILLTMALCVVYIGLSCFAFSKKEF
ncbi:MAG TPA: ABC transporter permease subunit [Candidatus Kapabacteria bacterium]|jgi:ABC-type transport system involved in multi-copper enzyme maturation permease subunit